MWPREKEGARCSRSWAGWAEARGRGEAWASAAGWAERGVSAGGDKPLGQEGGKRSWATGREERGGSRKLVGPLGPKTERGRAFPLLSFFFYLKAISNSFQNPF